MCAGVEKRKILRFSTEQLFTVRLSDDSNSNVYFTPEMKKLWWIFSFIFVSLQSESQSVSWKVININLLLLIWCSIFIIIKNDDLICCRSVQEGNAMIYHAMFFSWSLDSSLWICPNVIWYLVSLSLRLSFSSYNDWMVTATDLKRCWFKYSNEINYVHRGCKWICGTTWTWLQVDPTLFPSDNVFNLHDYRQICSCDCLSGLISTEYTLGRWHKLLATLDLHTLCPMKRCLRRTIGHVRPDMDTVKDRQSLPVGNKNKL